MKTARGKLTVGRGGRNTATSGAVDVANILLQACVGDTAGAVGHGTTGILRLGKGSGEGSKGEDSGNRELHFCGRYLVEGYLE